MFWPLLVVATAARLPAAEEAADHRILTAAELTGLTAACEDPLPAVGKTAAEILRTGIGPVRFRIRPEDVSGLPESLQRARPVDPAEPAVDDYRGWAGLLGLPDADQLNIHRHLRSPAASAAAEQVAGTLTSAEPAVVENAVITLRAMKASGYCGRLAGLLQRDDPALVVLVLETLVDLQCPGAAALAAKLLDRADAGVAGAAAEFLGRTGAKTFRGSLVAMLESRDPRLLASAMQGLAALDDVECVRAALLVLGAPDFLVPDEDGETGEPLDCRHDHLAAVRILGKHGDSASGPAIAALLHDPRSGVREAALMALGAVGDQSRAGAIAAMLGEDQPVSVRREAVRALGGLKAVEYSGRIAGLLDTGDLSLDAVRALGNMQDASHAAALRKVMSGARSPLLRAGAAEALLAIGALSALEAGSVISRLLNEATGASANLILEARVRVRDTSGAESILRHLGRDGFRRYDVPLPAVEALRNLGFDDHCQEIADFLNSGDPVVRSGALTAIRFFNARAFSDRVGDLLDRAQPEPVRIDALTALATLRSEDAERRLASLLVPGESIGVQMAALELVRQRRLTFQSAAVAGLLQPEVSGRVRTTALKVLVEIGGRVAVPAVVKLLHENHDPVLRREAAEALSGLKAAEAGPELAVLLTDPDPKLRLAGLRSIGVIGAIAQADSVATLLTGNPESVRREAVRTVGRLKSMRHAPALSALLKEPDMRALTVTTLGRMGATGESVHLYRLMTDWKKGFQPAVLAALMDCGGEHPEEGIAFLVEAVHQWPEHRPELLAAAWFLYARNTRVGAALPWLGNRRDDERPSLPRTPTDATGAVEALHAVFRVSAGAGCLQTQRDAGSVAAEIISATQWGPEDAGWLEGFAQELQTAGLPSRASAVQRAAATVRSAEFRNRLWRWLAAVVIAQPVGWMLVWLIYPWSRIARWMVRNRWFRRIAGFGWVGPLFNAVPALRSRLTGPLGEDRLPPGEDGIFDE